MRKLFKIMILTAAIMTVFSTQKSHAQVGFDIRGGYYQDAKDLFLGAGLNFNLLFFTANPNFEYVFVDGADFYTINLDGRVTVLPLVVGSGWLGGGVVLSSFKIKGGESDTNGGVNLLAGFGLDKLPLSPFAQIKYIISNNNQWVFGVGIRL